MMRPHLPLLALLFLTPVTGADVSIFHSTPGSPGNVLIHSEVGAAAPLAPAELQGITLLPIDFVGRTLIDLLASDRPRARAAGPTATRLLLPGGNGSLYLYRRDLPDGTAVFGLMLVGPAGAARSVWEALESSPGTGNPLLPQLGVAASGDALLFATTFEAGGDLIELDLATATATVRSAQLPPLTFSTSGLALHANWGIGAGPDGVFRFDRVPGAQLEAVPFPGNPVDYNGEVVCSSDGLVAATAVGSSPTLRHVYTFGPSGSALQISQTEGAVSGAGYLPNHLSGPYMALSEDGSACAWIDGGEAFWSEGTTPRPNTPFQLTSDALYLDTLDEIGVLFFLSRTLILAVGEAGNGGQIENIDFYSVETTAVPTAPAMRNLSLSSGTPNPPFFTKSAIQPGLVVRIPGSQKLLVLDSDAGANGQLLLIPTDGSPPTLLSDDAKSILMLEELAGDLVFVLRKNNLQRDRVLVRIPGPAPSVPSLIATVSDGIDFLQPTVRNDGWLAFALSEQGVGEWLVRFHVPTETGRLLTSTPLSYGSGLAWTPTGRLAFSLKAPGFPSLFLSWLPLIVFPNDSLTEGFVLPGSS